MKKTNQNAQTNKTTQSARMKNAMKGIFNGLRWTAKAVLQVTGFAIAVVTAYMLATAWTAVAPEAISQAMEAIREAYRSFMGMLSADGGSLERLALKGMQAFQSFWNQLEAVAPNALLAALIGAFSVPTQCLLWRKYLGIFSKSIKQIRSAKVEALSSKLPETMARYTTSSKEYAAHHVYSVAPAGDSKIVNLATMSKASKEIAGTVNKNKGLKAL